MVYSSTLIILLTYLIISGYDFKHILSDVNIFSFLVGVAGMFSDYGLIISYNVGWKVSSLNITYSIFVFLILLVIGVLLFNDTISNTKLMGVALCIISLFLMSYKNQKHKGRR